MIKCALKALGSYGTRRTPNSCLNRPVYNPVSVQSFNLHVLFALILRYWYSLEPCTSKLPLAPTEGEASHNDSEARPGNMMCCQLGVRLVGLYVAGFCRSPRTMPQTIMVLEGCSGFCIFRRQQMHQLPGPAVAWIFVGREHGNP